MTQINISSSSKVQALASPTPIAKLLNLLDKCKSHYNLIKQIHARSITLGTLTIHQNFCCKLLNTYAKLNRTSYASKMFDKIPSPDIVSWTSLLNLHLNNKQPSKALLLFYELTVSHAIKPDSHCIVAALSGCARTKDIVCGKTIHGMVYKHLEKPRPIVHNALIDMYGKNGMIILARRLFDRVEFRDIAIWTSMVNGYLLNGDIESSRRLFDGMPHRNVVSWTVMIVGYVRWKNAVGALELYRRMRIEDCGKDCIPTTVTIVASLSACADIGALDFGSSIHGYVNKRVGFVSDVAVSNGLIDMYSKSGNLDAALQIFDGMSKRDLFTWTSMISSLALHGRGRDALKIFREMEEYRIIPNEITFLSVLSACCHAGLVMEGERLFEKFVGHYNLKPRIEHFGCRVDLLCRAGRLKEAVQFVESMHMNADAVIWRSLLSACCEQGNLELAEVAGKKVLELEPDDDAVYVLLWSLYRSKKMWEDALRMAKMMRDQRIKKTPGCSWIEVNGLVHEFRAEVSPHHISDDTMMILYGMFKNSKLDMNLTLFELS